MHIHSIRRDVDAGRLRFSARNGLVFSALCLGLLLGLSGPAVGQLVTWVKPVADKELGLQIESVWPGVALRVADADTDKAVKAVGELGWQFEKFKFGDVLRAGGEGRAGTHPVKLTISKLPPGVQKVYVRYWSASQGPDQNWYALPTALGDAKRKWSDWRNWDWLVAGPGGQAGALYDRKLGTVGSKKQPATEVVITFDRYKWGRLARFGGLRIETEPDAETPQTAGEYLTDNTRPIHDTLMANGPKRQSGKVAYGLACTAGEIKVRPKLLTSLEGAPLAKKLALAGARGEWVSGQVVMMAPDQNLQVKSLAASALTDSETGKTIPADRITVAPVGFLFNDISYEAETHGWWPEPILAFLRKFTIAKGDLQPIWYQVKIPRETPPGTYRGEVTLTVASSPEAKIPVTVTVWDFTLPEAFHQAMAFSPGNLVNFPEFLLDYHIPPQSIYASTPPTRQQLERWSKDPRVSSFNVRYFWRKNMDPETKMPREGDLEKWLDQIGTCLADAEAVGIRDKAYVYMFDEAPPSDQPAFKLVANAIRQRFPDLLLVTTSYLCHKAEPEDNPIPAINGLCPRLGVFDHARSLRQRKTGKTIWWYVCNTPREPYPNITVLEPGIDHRLLLGFMAYQNNIEGFLYYAMSYGWRRTLEKTPHIKTGPYIHKHWKVWKRGDGNLSQLGPDGPLPTVRLELMRDGMEDYEYLYLAEELAEKLNGKKLPPELAGLLREVRGYFQMDNSLIRSHTNYTKDPAEIERVRGLIATFIVQAKAFMETQTE